jgi:hypothetical protein
MTYNEHNDWYLLHIFKLILPVIDLDHSLWFKEILPVRTNINTETVCTQNRVILMK